MALAVEELADLEPAPPEAVAVYRLSPQDIVMAIRNTIDAPSNQEVAEVLGAEGSASADMVARYGCFAADIINVLTARATQLFVSDENASQLRRLNTSLRKASRALSPFCRRTRRTGVLGRARAAVVRRLTRRARRT